MGDTKPLCDSDAQENYLKTELDTLLQKDPAAWQFFQKWSMDGVFFWDLEHPDNEYMSPEFWNLFGYDPATKTHNPCEWQDIIFEDDLKSALENFERHCENPEFPYDQLVRYRHKNGSIVWVRCRGVAIRNDAGKPIRMLGAHSDVTPFVQAEEKARAGWNAAEVANDELHSFAYSVSHDIKAPANTVHMLLDEMRKTHGAALPAEAREMLEMSVNIVERMKILIDDVLEYTCVIGGNPDFTRICLKTCVECAVADLGADILDRSARIEIGDLPACMGIETQITSLFRNLINNAIKFARHDVPPVIRIHAPEYHDETMFRIVVSDNGIGISEKDAPRIFDLFQRLHTRDAVPGTGIGLTMCKRVALNHHGRISLKSRPGKGSDFILELPRGLL